MQSLSMSLNILSDPTLLLLLNAVQSNRKSVLEHLDLSNNLIACGRDARECMDKYVV